MPDVVTAQVRVSANTSTGTQDITTSDLGGKTPKAVLFLYNYAVGVGASVDAGWGVGAATGLTERWTCFTNSEDASPTASASRVLRNDEVIKILNPGTSNVNGEADFDSFITNGVRIDWTNAPSAAFEILAIFFAGADVEAFAVTHPSTDGLDITDPGFQPNLIFAGATNRGPTSPPAGECQFGFGWQDGQATPDRQTQGLSENDGEPAGTPFARRQTDEAIVLLEETAGGVDYSGHYDTFDASGMTYRGIDDADAVAYLALKIDGVGIKVAAVDSPTSTGDWAVTGVGFEPQSVFLGLNMMTATDVLTSGANAGSLGYGVFTPSNEFSFSAQIEDGAATTNTQSYVEDAAAHLPNDDGTTGFVGDHVSMDSGGFTLNFTSVPGTARKWFYLAIEKSVTEVEKTHTTDALFKEQLELIHATDAFLNEFNELVHTTDSLLEEQRELTHITDALLQEEQEASHTTDAFLEEAVVPSVVVAQVRVAANTGTGTQDITTTELGGLTPKGVLLFWNFATGDGAFSDGALGIGAASGASERWAMNSNSEDGQADTDDIRVLRGDQIIQILTPGSSAIDGEADFDSFITNGVRIDWTDAPSAAFQIIAIFFAGTDVEAHAGTHASTDGLDITAPGFQPDLIFAGANNREPTETGGGGLQFGVGWQDGQATPDRQSHNISENNGEPAGTPFAHRRTDESALALFDDDGTVDYSGHYDTFDSSGMTFRATSDDSDHVAYLALKLPDTGIKVAAIDSPTSTGDWVVTGVGFPSQYVLIGLNMMTAVNGARSGAEAGSLGFGTFTPDNEHSISAQFEDAAATTNTQSYLEDKAAHLPKDDGTIGFVGDFVSIDSDGYTLNFTAVPGTIRKWFYLAIEGVEAAPIDKTHTTDALLQEEQTETHTTDALLKKTEELTHTTDSILEAANEMAHTTQESTHTTDSLLQKANQLSHSTDALLKKQEELTHTTDALLSVANELTHTTDSLLKKTEDRTHTTDALLKKTEDLVHSTDALLKKTEDLTHTTDSLLQEENELAHATDSLLKKAKDLVHTTDALLVEAQDLTHSTDALLKKTEDLTHSTDALLKKAEDLTHTTDALLFKQEDLTHTTDSLLAAPRRGQISWTELEVPSVGRGQVSWTELEVPGNRAQISWTELEVKTAPGIGPRA